MEQAILTLGQAALLLASFVSVLGVAYVALWLLAAIVRKVRQLANPNRQRVVVHRGGRPGGSARKW
jgi:hypothetical protein